jgi:predicted DCC family thiol-disulfide oxidoreductase YuxK
MGWPWRAAWLLWPIPAPVRDALYRLIALNRYALFGRSETCLMPPADFSKRFLD